MFSVNDLSEVFRAEKGSFFNFSENSLFIRRKYDFDETALYYRLKIKIVNNLIFTDYLFSDGEKYMIKIGQLSDHNLIISEISGGVCLNTIELTR